MGRSGSSTRPRSTPTDRGPIEEADWDYLNSFSLDDIEGEEPPYIEATQHGLLTDDPFSAAGLLLLPAAIAAGPGGLLAITGADSDAGVVAAILLLLDRRRPRAAASPTHGDELSRV